MSDPPIVGYRVHVSVDPARNDDQDYTFADIMSVKDAREVRGDFGTDVEWLLNLRVYVSGPGLINQIAADLVPFFPDEETARRAPGKYVAWRAPLASTAPDPTAGQRQEVPP